MRKVKIPKKIKLLCKKYHIRLSIKRGSKRVYKKLSVILKQLKRKIRKVKKVRKSRKVRKLRKTKRRYSRRSRFGEEVEQEGEGEELTPKEKKSFLKRVGGGIKKKAKSAGGAIKRNPVKAGIATLAIVGGAALMAASGGALGGPAQLMVSTALKSASGSVGKLGGKLGKMGDKVAENAKKGMEALPNPADALQKVQETQQLVQTSQQLVGPLIKQGEQQTVDAVQEAAETGVAENIPVAATPESEAQAQVVAATQGQAAAAFGKRKGKKDKRSVNYFGHYSVTPYAAGGNQYSSQQVYNFGKKRKKFYRKN